MRLLPDLSWIAEDFKAFCEQLKKPHTWIMIGMLLLFGVIIVLTVYFMLRIDFTLRLWRISSLACKEIGNLQTVGLYFGGLAFALAMVTAFGEFANYIDNKKEDVKASFANARRALLLAAVATLVGGGILAFVAQLCG